MCKIKLEDEEMVVLKIKCIHYGSEEIVKMGYQKNGTPRCKCKNCEKTFQREYVNKGSKSETNDNKDGSEWKRNKRYGKSSRN